MWPLFMLLAGTYFEIKVVDEATGRGVPLVELRTTSEISSWTDSNGIVAWNEPGLMDRPVYFRIQSPGYDFAGGGKTLQVVSGGQAELKIRRVQAAERLYRVTGQGIYRDSVLTGAKVPIREPVLNGMVMGQDTVRAIPYRGRLFWLWGDTNRPSGPLGNFNTTAATSALPGSGGLDPSAGIDLTYFTGPNGFVRQMIPWTGGMTWMHSLMTLRDQSGEERLVAFYEVMRSLGDVERAGLAVFNDAKQEFDPLVEFPGKFAAIDGIAFPVRAGGRDYYYFTGLNPGGVLRVPADWKAVQEVARYETFDGAWQAATPSTRKNLNSYTDVESGNSLSVHCDSIAWNAYRKRWIATLEHMPGEVWYAEADSPAGPWVYATRVAVHGKYTFYWPSPHPFYDQEDGRVVYFEGTYTDSFSGNPVITPRYNYNQIMYRLRLDDERLFLPAPVYRLRDGRYLMREGVAAAKAWDQVESAPFYAMAPDRHREGTVPVAGIFYAAPIGASVDAGPASGEWNCQSNEDEFSLRIGERDGSVRLRILGEDFTTGSYRAGTLTVEIPMDGILYHLTGNYGEGKITGGWKEDGGGTFTCSRPSSAAWRDSKALTPLYYYDGTYTTEPSPRAAPIGRVWRSPPDRLMLDRAAAAAQ